MIRNENQNQNRKPAVISRTSGGSGNNPLDTILLRRMLSFGAPPPEIHQ